MRTGWIVIACAAAALGEEIPCPPADRPVADRAVLLSAPAEERIAELCRRLERETGAPMIVLTLDSLREQGAEGIGIERFATRLLTQWQFEPVEADGRKWGKAILLLVAVAERKCRIELGVDWGSSRNAQSVRILDDWILPRFRSGSFEAGIEEGVRKLDAMARGESLPVRRSSAFGGFLLFGAVALLSVVSFARRGSQGVAWTVWRGLFSLLGILLAAMASSRAGRRRWGAPYSGFGFPVRGGGFRIGGSGGGFRSGGGSVGSGRGATGSW